jgi:hypothetical protein
MKIINFPNISLMITGTHNVYETMIENEIFYIVEDDGILYFKHEKMSIERNDKYLTTDSYEINDGLIQWESGGEITNKKIAKNFYKAAINYLMLNKKD